MTYRIIEHTADIGIEVEGRDLKELFENAAAALFAIILESGNVTARASKELDLSAPSVELLLRDWLSELNYLHQVEGWLFCAYDFPALSQKALAVKAKGELFDPGRHRLGREIKAVTYHDLSLRPTSSGYTAQVLFDV